jgi:transcriptional regulator with XRE-family HTH domain
MPVGEAKEPHHIDQHVGLAVRNRRKSLGMTQPELAELLDISFQQVQRYETGAVRISASKLYEIALALKTTVCYFFIDVDETTSKAFAEELDVKEKSLLACAEGIELADLFPKITDANIRQTVVDLVRALQGDGAIPASSVGDGGGP